MGPDIRKGHPSTFQNLHLLVQAFTRCSKCFLLKTSISGMLKLPTYGGWSFLTASQSSQVSLHTLIYRPREAKCSQLPAFQTQAGFITSLHPHHLNQPNFSHWYERASTTALGRPFNSNNLHCPRWQKNNWNFSITTEDQTTFSQLQCVKGTDVELDSYLPNTISTA